jgi:hypothetical protein
VSPPRTGGGFGDPFARALARVAAREDHDRGRAPRALVIDPRMLAVDEGATRELRGGRPGGAA